jgi:ferredoxin
VALAVLAVLTAVLADFRGTIPPRLAHWAASTQFVPSILGFAAGSAFGLVALAILASALLAGRLYCSFLCPLGILQDVAARLAARWRPRLRHARPMNAARYGFLWATVLAVLAGWGAAALTLLDPWSNYGRVASGFVRPVLALANNVVARAAGAAGLRLLVHVKPPWAGAGALAVPALVLTLIVVLSSLRGRLYCNSVCPVGTVLGLAARQATFRFTIDPAACRKCGDCLGVCKAQCIDLRTVSIDFSRCVTCFNCVGACTTGGIGYELAWFRDREEAAAPRQLFPLPSDRAAAPDPGRRAFVAGAAILAATVSLRASGFPAPVAPSGAATGPAVCPPGSGGVDRFVDHCTACQLCVTACPSRVLQPSFLEYGLLGLMKPRLDFAKGYCTYGCRACAEACPDGAILALPLAEKKLVRIGRADLDVSKCIVKTKGTDCAACSEQCPTQAVFTEPYGLNLRLPRLDPDLCIGCGACANACPAVPAKAITVAGLRYHERARQPVEKRAANPVPGGDFPF